MWFGAINRAAEKSLCNSGVSKVASRLDASLSESSSTDLMDATKTKRERNLASSERRTSGTPVPRRFKRPSLLGRKSCTRRRRLKLLSALFMPTRYLLERIEMYAPRRRVCNAATEAISGLIVYKTSRSERLNCPFRSGYFDATLGHFCFPDLLRLFSSATIVEGHWAKSKTIEGMLSWCIFCSCDARQRLRHWIFRVAHGSADAHRAKLCQSRASLQVSLAVYLSAIHTVL